MYAGGRIRRLISTVASPFHPFGGAVDIIVVQQQDGSYKSTPWYVRFGKFQGVLKRSEAIVTVTVNGVEANFNLYLDSSGEAYLLKEPDSDEEEDINSPRSSQSSEEAVLICNDSFKSLASQEYVDAQSDENGESELASPSVHGVSEVNQKKGNITITISEHNSMIADNRQRNDLPDGSLNHNLQNNDPESNLPMASEKTGDSILSMAENKDAPYGYPAGKVENRGGHLYSHMQSSFKENSIRNITTDNNENKKEGTERNNARKSHLETSLLLMEETINNYKVSRKSSEDDPLFLSEYNSYEYENMEFQQLDASDSTKTENENTEMVLMSVDGHMMTAPITSFKITDIVTLSDEATAEDIANNQDNYETCAEKETIADITIIQGNCETNVTANPDDCEKRAGAEEDINCGTSYACDSHVLDVNEGCNGHKQEQNLEDVTYGVENSQKVASDKISRDIQKELTLGMDLGKTKEDTLLRNESDLELVLNDDELYSGTDEEKYGGLYPCPEKEETEDAVAENKNINAEKDGVSSFQSYKSNPINVPGLHMIDKEVKAASGSLPNIMSHFPRTDIANSESLCSRSLDSCYSPGPRAKKIESVNPSSDALERRESVFNETTLGRMDTTTDTSKDLSQLNNLNYQGVTAQQSMDIEISLCRELLFKGMGSQAAAHAFASRRISREHFTNSASDILKNEKLVVKIKGRYFPWFAAASIVLGMVAFGLEVPDCNEAEILVDHVESKVEGTQASDSNSPSPGGWRLWPFSFRKPKAPETMASVSKSLTTATKTEEDLNSDSNMKNDHKKPQLHRVRTNIPSSEQLASLNLKEGQNMITFTFQTSVWGKQEVDARIYLWKWNTRVVISDVDGTITKSDVLGQVMPWVGKDWTQTGVARLFSAIKDNGYQLLFLSARALAQAYLTRQFLLNLKQDGKKLPDGPVVISPDGLFPSLYREVIRRAPHEFKISCLEDIRALFPPECNPFYAGFGNRDTDEISYLKVGIPKGKIFIINPKGQVVVNHCVDVKSYTSLHKLADDMFPPVSSCEQEDFNSWNYWKVPLPVIED